MGYNNSKEESVSSIRPYFIHGNDAEKNHAEII
jgi:hypothetical protein